MRAAVLTISTTRARGEGDEVSGAALVELCQADQDDVRFVFTTGGTGMTADDVTPEATRDVIDREAPGYAETIRLQSRQHTDLGILTRGVSGIRGRTLIVNFPGSPNGVLQSWPVVEPTLEHAAAQLERA
jgi:molybdenum cofactor synthesis domain-containing protein